MQALGRAAHNRTAAQFTAGLLPVIEAVRRAGATSLAEIAGALNHRSVRSATGSRWHRSSARIFVRIVGDFHPGIHFRGALRGPDRQRNVIFGHVSDRPLDAQSLDRPSWPQDADYGLDLGAAGVAANDRHDRVFGQAQPVRFARTSRGSNLRPCRSLTRCRAEGR